MGVQGQKIGAATFLAYTRARLKILRDTQIYRALDGDADYMGGAMYYRVVRELRTGVRLCP